MTLNGIMVIIGRYFAEFGSFRGQLRKSGRLAINRFIPRNVIKYIVSQKNCRPTILHSFITSTNVGRFSKFFHYCIPQEICNKAHSTLPTKPKMCELFSLAVTVEALRANIK